MKLHRHLRWQIVVKESEVHLLLHAFGIFFNAVIVCIFVVVFVLGLVVVVVVVVFFVFFWGGAVLFLFLFFESLREPEMLFVFDERNMKCE